MEQSNQSKKVLLSVIGVAILVVAVVGVSFAFFNYTRAGQSNSVQTGKIWFNSTQNRAISLTNVFPGQSNGDTVEVTVTGGTTYSEGMKYRLRAVNVMKGSSAYNGEYVKVTSAINGENVGSGTYTPAGTVTLAEGVVIGTGTVPYNASATSTDLNGIINVTAFIDSNVAITDTPTSESAPTGYVNGTTTSWINERTVVSTSEWNSLATNAVTFRIQVEAIENGGTYVNGQS